MLIFRRTALVTLLLICVVLMLVDGCCNSNDTIGVQDDSHCIPGDADGNGVVDRDDAEFIIEYIIKGGPPPDPLCCADADGTGFIDIDDAVTIINNVASGGLFPDPDACENWPE